MIVRNKAKKVVLCPGGGFVSHRYLLESDKMGFTLTRTLIPGGRVENWHYKKHLEACMCVSGVGVLTNVLTGDQHHISKNTMYALDKNDNHIFEAITDVELVCVFNPPLVGQEVHAPDGSY